MSISVDFRQGHGGSLEGRQGLAKRGDITGDVPAGSCL